MTVDVDHKMSRARIGFVLFSIAIMLMVLVGLGTWQVQRLEWKRGILDTIDSRIGNPAVPLPPAESWPTLDPATLDYTPVSFNGRLNTNQELHVYTALSEANGPLAGPGYWILSPLELEGGGWVLINRGFVPQANKDPASRTLVQNEQANDVQAWQGVLRRPDREGFFIPDDDPAANQWFRRDPQTMAQALGVEPLAPFYVDLAAGHTPQGGMPQAGETRINIPNNHLEYAITWYSLAVVLVIVSGAWLWQTRNRR